MGSTDSSTRGFWPIPDSYQAPAAPAEADFREKKSRFLAFLRPATDPTDARLALEEVRRLHPDASHHCWAWRLGAEGEERCSDDGEPAGTAGLPILQVLRGSGLSDVLVVVVRWFGGIKLGKGGLVRAYGEAARQALATVRSVERFSTETVSLEVPYSSIGAVKRLVRPPDVELVEESYGERAKLVLSVRRSLKPTLEEALADLGLEGASRAPGSSPASPS